MTDPQEFDRLRRALRDHAREASMGRTPECLDDDSVAALADGHLDPVARSAALLHLAVCARCRAAVASVARALSDPKVARQLDTTTRVSDRRILRVLIPAAAAAIILLLAWPPAPPTDQLAHRAPTITAAPAPSGMWPAGATDSVGALRWVRVAGADRYRVTLFDATGEVLFETEVTDTVAVLPDSIDLAAGQRYLWKVEARTGFGRWAASKLVEFSVAGTTPQ